MLEIISLKKTYVTKAGDTVALNDVNLRFPETGLVFITGKSGSGKTTLLNIIGGLDNFDSGCIKLNGKSFSDFTDSDFDSYRNTFVGFVFQEYNLLNEYNVEKNVDIALELQGQKSNPEKRKELFKSVEISGLEGRKPNQLSGGQKQRVAILRALVKNPKIILADELTGALDSVTGAQILDILKNLSKEKLVIVVSHDLELAEKYADRIIKIADGKVVDDVSISNVDMLGNIHQTTSQLTVKMPSELTEKENKVVVEAIKQNKKIVFTEKISIREKSKTVQPEVKLQEEDIKLINSKMKLSSATSLGFKSIWTKPLRLIFTILLSVIAFSVFGLFDSIASYNNAKVIKNLLATDTYQALPLYLTYTDDYYTETKLKFSQEYIDEINNDSNYNFKGVYDLKDNGSLNTSSEIINKNNSIQPNGWMYYLTKVNGIITFNENEIVRGEENMLGVVGTGTFDYPILYGSYPTFEQPDEGEIPTFQIGISSYIAKSIKFWSQANGILLNDISELIGYALSIDNYSFVITAIIDCGEISSKYDTLKVRAKEDKQLLSDFETYINSGCYLNLFAPEGFVDYIRQLNNRTVNYISDTKNNLHMISLDGNKNAFSGKFYNIANVEEDKFIFFDTQKTELADNEVLINIDYFQKDYLAKDISSISLTDKQFNINDKLSAINSSDNKIEKSNYIQELFSHIKNSLSYFNPTKTIKITTTAKQGGNVLSDVNLNVVGVYFDLDTDVNDIANNYKPLMVSSGGLENLHVRDNQGMYSRIVSPLFNNPSGERVISNMMDEDVNENLNWYANSVLGTVQEERQLIEQIIDLILYLAIILAVFSIFMLFNYISLSIASKRQTIGVLRTLGANRKNIFVMFITEALIISIINGTLGALVAYLLCILVNTYVVEIMYLTFSIALFDYRQIFIIMIASLISGILSSIVPIIKISKKKPVELVRNV